MPVREKIYLALAALFVSSLLIANIITFKLFTIPLPGGLRLFDVRAFHFWKRLTAARHLWLRNNLSTVASQLLDSILVITILFYDVLSFEAIVQIIVASYVFKVLFALIDTPLIYLGVHLLGPHVRGAGEERSRNVR